MLISKRTLNKMLEEERQKIYSDVYKERAMEDFRREVFSRIERIENTVFARDGKEPCAVCAANEIRPTNKACL